ncbi:MAG: hypothetical protein ACREEV_06580 [Dongiaceae bacterium]
MPVDPIQSALPVLANLLGSGAKPEPAPLRAQVLSLPNQIAGASLPVSLSGVVAESPIQGQLRITTSLGEVQLRTPTELPPGRAVTIVTRPNVPTEVFLLPNATPKATPHTGLTPQATPAAPSNRPPPVSPLQAGAARPAGLTVPMNTGQPLVAAPSQLSSGPPPVAVASPNPGSAAVSPANNSAMPYASAPVDGGRNVPVAGRATQQPAPSPAAPTLSPTSLVATFGQTVVSDRVGGTPYAAPAQPGPPSELLALLTDMRRIVAARDPKLAERLMRRLPSPDRGGALALLALPVAAQREAVAPWFGRDVAAAIRDEQDESKGDLIERVTANLVHGEERVDEFGERTWRWRQLPLVDQGHIVPLFIGVAQRNEEPEPDADGKPRRARIFEFAVEVVLSGLGCTRIGAVYQQRRLDLVVQTEIEIEQDGREHIVAAVADTFEEFGLGGSCRFEPYRGDLTTPPVKI